MKLKRYRSTKSYYNLPCAHRQHLHPGHCKFVHGYSRSFHFLFEAVSGELDPCGFVADFADLRQIKQWLDENFDHTLLLNPNDPLMAEFRDIEAKGGAKIVVIPTGVSMEGTAQWVYETWAPKIREMWNGDVELIRVEVRENDKNSGIFEVDLV